MKRVMEISVITILAQVFALEGVFIHIKGQVFSIELNIYMLIIMLAMKIIFSKNSV